MSESIFDILFSLSENYVRIATVYLVAVNILAFFLYALDKRQAERHRERIPERILLIIAAIGGSPLALIAMYLFNHKTRKKKFSLGVPLMLIIQVISVCFLLF